jgi:hypothetical protein
LLLASAFLLDPALLLDPPLLLMDTSQARNRLVMAASS